MLTRVPLQTVAILLCNAMCDESSGYSGRRRPIGLVGCGLARFKAVTAISVWMRRLPSCAACVLALVLCFWTSDSLVAQAPAPVAPDGDAAAKTVPVSTQKAASEKPTPEPERHHVAAIPNSPIEIAQSMGLFFLGSFLLASVVALWFGIERLVVLRSGRVIPRPFVQRFLDHLEQGKLTPTDALKLCEDNGSPVASVFAHGVRKWGKTSVEVEQAIIDGGERQVSQLRRHL